MKAKKKMKSHTKQKKTRLPIGMQETYEVPKSRIPKEKFSNTFSPMETGQADEGPLAEGKSPRVGKRIEGPLDQVGEGERQSDQLAELEQIEPEE